MPKAKYGTKEYKAVYNRYRKIHKTEVLTCSEPVCVMDSRNIYPGDKMCISHDPSGEVILGPSHATCNYHEAAVRGNRMRAGKTPESTWDFDKPSKSEPYRVQRHKIGYWNF